MGRLQTCVRSLKSTNLPFSRCDIFVSFRDNVGINCTLRQQTILDSCGTNKDDLECPIQLIELKVRMSHGLLADSVDTSLASQPSLLYSCKTDAVLTAQWSARSVSEPRKTCVADALSLCGSWASCYNSYDCHLFLWKTKSINLHLHH